MKKETLTQIILTAEDGKYLYDGNTYGKTVVLPLGADTALWQEIEEKDLPKEEIYV